MTPLQRIAMGLVIVFGVAEFPAHPRPAWRHYDGLADPLGWVLVVAGVITLARMHRTLGPSLWLSIAAGVVSLPLWFPQLNHLLVGAGVWAVLLPQNLACLLLCREVGRLGATQEPRDRYVAKRFGLLAWGFTIITVLPILIEGGRIRGADPAANTVKYVVVIAAVYYLFRVHRRAYLGGPGPLEFPRRTVRDQDLSQPDQPGPDAARAAPDDPERPS